MPSTFVLGLVGASVASTCFAMATRQTYRRIAWCIAAGAGGGAALAYYNDSIHRIDCKPIMDQDATHVRASGRIPVAFRPSFHSMKEKIYSHLTERFEELGQLEIGEEAITVQPHVFAQIGVIDEEGIRNMWRMISLDLHEKPKHGVGSPTAQQDPVVFCDLGSGVGNVCLQVLAETTCKSVVGVEIIPSRHRAAQLAYENAKKYFPAVFGAEQGTNATFVLQDIVGCEKVLNAAGVNVIFTHSWMFDDDLMHKVTCLVQKMPQIKMVITSKPLDHALLKTTPLSLHKLVHFSADWNESAPFHVYFRDSRNALS